MLNLLGEMLVETASCIAFLVRVVHCCIRFASCLSAVFGNQWSASIPEARHPEALLSLSREQLKSHHSILAIQIIACLKLLTLPPFQKAQRQATSDLHSDVQVIRGILLRRLQISGRSAQEKVLFPALFSCRSPLHDQAFQISFPASSVC